MNSDTIARVPLVATMLAETPCTDILGLVIYDLPGRDCAAKASNGELKTGELSKYESQYIDRKWSQDRGFVYSNANFMYSNCCCH
jgi:cellulase/cellobiase CelA1